MGLKDTVKIVLADDNDIVRQMISDTLSEDKSFCVAGEAADGESAVELIKKERPDIVLLDLVMPKLDGMGVMDRIKNSPDLKGYSPEYIILSAAGREDIISEALNSGASYFMMKPFDGEALIRRIKYIMAGDAAANAGTTVLKEKASDDVRSVERAITELLRNIGVPIKMVGYKYLRDAIEITVKSQDDDISITKTIYPEVAQIHDTSPGNVERNIRYVIEATWQRRSEKNEDIFSGQAKRPTNTEFILTCAEHIKLEFNL